MESKFFKKILNLGVLNLINGGFYSKSLCGASPFIKIGVYIEDRMVLDGSPVFQKYPDMACRSIKATAFHYSPFTTISENAEGKRSYTGLEVNIFKTTAKKLGLSYEIGPPTDGEKWGRFSPPNHFSGLMGDMQYERSDVDTVKEVIADPRPVISFGENFKNDLSKSDDPIIGQILENYKFHYDFDGALRNLSLGTVIMAETLQSTLYKIRAQFTNKFGETTIHTLRECLTPYRVAFALQKHSIYKKPFSRVIQKLKEGGFVNKWLNNEMDLVARLQTKTSVLSTAEAKPLSLNEFQAAGLVYLCFLALSLIGLGLELILHYSKRLKATPTMYGRWNTEY
ncbi:hypothetical protein TCAL_02716 [Tigriopus californicus]|uniref:Ionotropic glutamate receptor L-glutamate and glycine-binding domain-containing protein n=1 Tax=Tigriopus californicus TaxID=6832 RepID=A0A553PFC9_TIGCA|nr:hypothetical protein TCAL_02716 [Tigriopus californicus]